MSEPSDPGQLSTVELMSQVSAQTMRLVRDEMRLAQKELQESVRHAGVGAGLISVAGLLTVLGLATVVAALVAALSLVLASAAIVAAMLFAVAGIAALVSKKQAELVPPPAAESIDSVKRDIAEIKEAANDRS